jgi:hypothetical protein
MEKFRIKQVQSLLKESGPSLKNKDSFNEPKEGIIDSQLLADVINLLIESDEYVYQSRPDHKLTKDEAKTFCNHVLTIRSKIDVLLSDFGVIEIENLEEDVKKLSENYIFLTTKGDIKKSIVKLGVDPQRIIVAGVPLELDDMKKLNPKIPEKALEPVKKKINRVKEDIERKKSVFNTESILVTVTGDLAGQILSERAEEFYNARKIQNANLKDIEINEFLKMLRNC